MATSIKHLEMATSIRARAPLRISFAGGGTDVPQYIQEHGGAVLCTTTDQYAYVTLRSNRDRIFKITSQDYDLLEIFKGITDLEYNGRLDIVKAGLRALGVGTEGFDAVLHADAPPGSGLGSSSAVGVALVGCLLEYHGKVLSSYEIADLTYRIERLELGMKGGMQDQYVSTFGGFNFIEFKKSGVVVNPLRLKAEITNELLASMILCDSGLRHVSGDILTRQMDGYAKGRTQVVEGLHAIKELAYEMKDAIVKGDIGSVARLFHEGWMHKRNLDSSISNPHIDGLYQFAQKQGAKGGKLLGAGGGGYLLLLCDPDDRSRLMKEMIKKGCNIVRFNFDNSGLQTWRVQEKKVLI